MPCHGILAVPLRTTLCGFYDNGRSKYTFGVRLCPAFSGGPTTLWASLGRPLRAVQVLELGGGAEAGLLEDLEGFGLLRAETGLEEFGETRLPSVADHR